MIEQLVTGIKFWLLKIDVMESKTRKYVVTPDELSQKFIIGIKKAKDTI